MKSFVGGEAGRGSGGRGTDSIARDPYDFRRVVEHPHREW